MEEIKCKLSEDFAIKIIKCFIDLEDKRKERIMSKQLLKSGTSIGANIAESIFAESKDDFVHKLKISLKEASETNYWLRLLYRTDFISEVQFNELTNDCTALIKLLISITNTAKHNTF